MEKNQHCSNCGAPTTSEICPYCHVSTGISSKEANMEYPVIDCKEANLGFWTVIFPLIFAISFGLPGIILLWVSLFAGESVVLWISIPFTLIGGIAFYITYLSVSRYRLLQKKGKEIEAVVYGYMNDNLLINDSPAQIVKLLVQTKEGPRFILYQLGDTKKPYKINSKTKLLVYEDKFMIVKNKKNYFE